MERRELGHTGECLSLVGMGGIVVMGVTASEARSFVAEAVDRGVSYFDVAPAYGDAEERLGPALEPFRPSVFLACKTGRRDAVGAREELESSLKRLHTDHVDLYQMHALTTMDDVKQALGPGGAAEAFVRAREEGLVRFLGFSAHSVEGALEAMRQFSFDTVMFPINFVTYYEESFGPEVLNEAERQGMGRLALKAMARSPWPAGANRVYPKCWYEPISDPEMASLALRFTLSMAVTAAVAPGHMELLRMALDIAENFTPLTDNEKERLKAAAHSLSPIFHRNPAPDA